MNKDLLLLRMRQLTEFIEELQADELGRITNGRYLRVELEAIARSIYPGDEPAGTEQS